MRWGARFMRGKFRRQDTLILPIILFQLRASSPELARRGGTPAWPLGHFATLLFCALLISIVFGCVFHSTTKTRILAVLRYFLLLVIFALALAWLMLPFSH